MPQPLKYYVKKEKTTMENQPIKRSHKRIGSSQNPLRVHIKKLADNAVIPTYAHPTDAGMDLYATTKTFDEYGNMVIGTGIAVAIPKGYVGLLFPRSSISQHYCYLTDSVGVIDSGYRGEITFKFAAKHISIVNKSLWKRLRLLFAGKADENENGNVEVYNWWGNRYQYQIGDRIGQLIIMPYPQVSFTETDNLPDSDRGTGGYGSTGK